LILGEIARRRPALVVIAGDLVFDGSSPRHWNELDRLSEPLRASSIPVLAVPGNHDYWVAGPKNLTHYFARFPHLQEARWTMRRYAPVALVLLDSNEDQMTSAEWNDQRCWYEETLRALDLDPSVRGVVVVLHHPPYTNSTLTGDEAHVQRAFVPAFLRSDKTLCLISGHVHSYERFERDGKTFLVSGGGGGPRARLKTWGDRRHPDDLFQGPALRDFHFLELQVRDAGVHVRVVGLPKGKRAFYEMDSLDLPFGG
jgi:Icc-related predicted phosphoesterase